MSGQRWFLPTNTENMELFLSNGLMTCSDGLKKSYIKDTLDDCPKGYIPFFSIHNLLEAIYKSTGEEENLIKCIIELNYSQIININIYAEVEPLMDSIDTCSYIGLKISDITELNYHKKILIPSPLPMQCIKGVFFENTLIKNEISKNIERKFGQYPSRFFLVEKNLFNGRNHKNNQVQLEKVLSNSNQTCLPELDINYEKIFSLGGMLGLMFYQTKNSQESIECFVEASSLNKIENQDKNEFKLFNNYFYDDEHQNEEYSRLCYSLIKLISEDKGNVGEVSQAIIDYLELDINYPELQEFNKKMAKGLRKIIDRDKDYMSPETVFSRVVGFCRKNNGSNKILLILTMYFFRDKPETMLKFYHEEFQSIDYVLFAIFFGINCQYIGLPEQIKQIKGLGYYISNRMAEYHHKSFIDDGSVFKNDSAIKFILKDFLKESSNGDRDKFFQWFFDFVGLNSNDFQCWKMNHKGFHCEPNSQFTFKIKPKVTTVIDMTKLERQLLLSTTNNDKDLFNYNEVYSQYEKLKK